MRTMILTAIATAAIAAGATGAGATPRAAARTLDLSVPADALTAMRKVQCSTRDREAVVYHWSGKVFSRVDGEPDRHLFDVEGMNVRQCTTVVDAKRGTGFRQVSRELMFYLDPVTHAVLKTWTNPWTGKTVDVVHVANDPVNMRSPLFPIDRDGKPFDLGARIEGGRVFMPTEVPLFYTNPLAGDYQAFAGNQYHAMEIFDFTADARDLLDASKPRADPAIAWVRISPWLPWMEMAGRGGVLVFNATGGTVAGIAALPPVIREQIAATYETYAAPPPVDDARPNETSWTFFKKKMDAAKK